MNSLLPFATPLLVFIGFFFGFAYLGGWRALARKYPLPPHSPTRTFLCRQARLGYTGPHYGAMIRIGFSERGVFVRPIFVVMLFHPAFFVPWSEVSSQKSNHWFYREELELVLGGASEGLHVLLSSDVAGELDHYCPTRS